MMKTGNVAAIFVALVFFGQGCTTSVSSLPPPGIPTPHVQPLRQTADNARPQIEDILGIALPRGGVTAYPQSSVPKQEGALFYGSSFRLTLNAQEYDRLVGRALVLNVTDPNRDPLKVLRDPMRQQLGCVDDGKTYGTFCEIKAASSSTSNGLEVHAFPVQYRIRSGLTTTQSGTSTVWLVRVPKNDRAWMYVVPADFGDASSTRMLYDWISDLKLSK